jgi:phosphoglycerate dehydrogenase-like enzyme
MPELPQTVNIVVVRDVARVDLDRIKAVAPDRLKVTGVWRGIRDELMRTFPPDLVTRFERSSNPLPPISKEEAEQAIREGHVAFCGRVHPPDLYSRMPNLRWVHIAFAGLSTIRGSQFWGATNIDMTSSRGHTGALPIAEMALTGALMLAKDLHVGVQQTLARELDTKPYKPWLIKGKTMGVVGLGGIGMNLVRLAKGVGMRVVGTKRSATRREAGTDGLDEVFPPSELYEMLATCDVVGICAPFTTETERMFNKEAFAAMKQGAILVNIARGEIIDEPALAEAIRSGKLAGAYLDVFAGEEEGALPPNELMSLTNVVMTPHITYRSDVPQLFAMDLFCDNLRRLLDGKPLVNLVDWERGY